MHEWINALLTYLGSIPPLAVYLFIFGWLAVESAGISLPNESVLLFGGYLAGTGKVSVVLLTVMAVAGSLAGAQVAYSIGRFGDRQLILKLGRYIGLTEKKLDSSEVWFAKHGAVAIFLARLLPFIRTLASYPAGISQMNPVQFLGATSAGSLLWCAIFIWLGKKVGDNFQMILSVFEKYTLPVVALLALLVICYLFVHNKLKQAEAAN